MRFKQLFVFTQFTQFFPELLTQFSKNSNLLLLTRFLKALLFLLYFTMFFEKPGCQH